MTNNRYARSLSIGKLTFFNNEGTKSLDEIDFFSPRSLTFSGQNKEEKDHIPKLTRETSLSTLFTPRWRKSKDSEIQQLDIGPRHKSQPKIPKISDKEIFQMDDFECIIPKPSFPEEKHSHLRPTVPIPITDKHLQWLTLSCKGTPPSPRIHHTACSIGDTMYIFGGTDGGSLKNQLFLLDLNTYTWIQPVVTGKKPSHRYGHSCTVVENFIYIFGGKTKTDSLNDLFVLDTKNMNWYKIPKRGAIPPSVAYHNAHYFDKKIYIMGGTRIDGSSMDSIYYFDIEEQTWHKTPLKLKGRSMAASIMISQNVVMIIGGFRSKHGKFAKRPIKYPLIVDLQTNTIISTTIKAPRVTNHSSFIHDGSIVIFGGRTSNLVANSDITFYDYDSWRKVKNIQGDIPSVTYGQSVVVVKNKIIFFGGISGPNFVKETYMLQVGSMKSDSLNTNDKAFELLSQPNPDVLHRRAKIKYINIDEISIVGRIANGATCVVHQAKWKNKSVVIKQYFNYDQEIFVKEITILCGLRHKNIVKFLGCVINDNKMGVILEYLPLGDLFNFLRKQAKPLDWHLILHMTVDVANAMNYLHQNNILHRDLKSSNLLVASTSHHDKVTIKVMDFGDSKEISHKREEEVCGTVRWTSPEVFKKEAYSPKSDVFSFGIILWELISLQTPYEHLRRDYEVEDFVLNGGRPSIQLISNLCFKQLIEACWDQLPANRPSFDEILLILEEIRRKILPLAENDLSSDRTLSDHEDLSEK